MARCGKRHVWLREKKPSLDEGVRPIRREEKLLDYRGKRGGQEHAAQTAVWLLHAAKRDDRVLPGKRVALAFSKDRLRVPAA